MKKKIISFLLCGFILLGFPIRSYSLDQIDVLSYNMLEQVYTGRNPDILENNKAHARTVDNANTTGNWSASIVAQGYNTVKSNYQIVWNAQKSYADYNDLKRDLNLSQAKEAQLTYQLKITSLKESVGRATKEEVVKAENSLSDQKRITVQLQEDVEKAIRDFNLDLGQKTDIPLIIEAVPEPDLQAIRVIDVDKDYEAARLLSFDIKVVELPGYGKDQREQDLVRIQFKENFYTVYKGLQDALEDYEYAQKLADIAQKDYEVARKKLGYGILSQLDFVNADYTWNSKLADITTAKEDLFIAYQRYEWAKRGLIFN